MSEVVYTDEFGEWFESLEPNARADIDIVIGLLAETGVALCFPHSSSIEESNYALRELRPKQGRSPLRIIYAFDPMRDAVLIIGGNKGQEHKFYKRIVKKAEGIWQQYLDEQESGSHDKEEE